jgi:TRAP-type C4-dicarboxylate transport system permease small subunit
VTPMAERLARVQRGYVLSTEALAVAMMAATIVIMSLQVFYRYFLASSLIWAEEMCRYLLVWMTFLFIGAAFQRGEMVGFEMLVGKLPGWLKASVLGPSYLITVGFLGVLVYHGWLFAEQNSNQAIPAADFIWQSLAGRDSGISVFWIYVSVPVGCAILALHLLVSAARLVLP